MKERGLKNEQELEEFCACKLLKFGRLLGEGLKFSERKKKILLKLSVITALKNSQKYLFVALVAGSGT